jgi:hypothetical protein
MHIMQALQGFFRDASLFISEQKMPANQFITGDLVASFEYSRRPHVFLN